MKWSIGISIPIFLLILIIIGVILFKKMLIFKIKILNKKIQKINSNIEKLKQVNDQFFELGKDNIEYKKLEEDIANKICNYEINLDKLKINLNKIMLIKNDQGLGWLKKYKESKTIIQNSEKLLKTSLNLNKQKSLILFFDKSNEISKNIIFLTKTKKIFFDINQFISNNQKNDFLIFAKKSSLNLKNEINDILNDFEQNILFSNNKNLYNQNKILKLLSIYSKSVFKGIAYFDYINNNIESPLNFLKNLVELYSNEYQNIFKKVINKEKIKELEEKIKSLKENLIKNTIEQWDKKYLDLFYDLEKEIQGKYLLLNNEMNSLLLLKNQQDNIKKIINQLLKNNQLITENNLILKKYNNKYNDFINNEYIYLKFIMTKNFETIEDISFKNKKEELIFLLKKIKEILNIQSEIIQNFNEGNIERNKEILNDKFINCFAFHNFEYKLTDEIIFYQNLFNQSIKNYKNYYQQNLIENVIKLINLLVIELNLKIKISKNVITNFFRNNKDTNNPNNQRIYAELINLFYMEKFDEIISKTVKKQNDKGDK